MSRAVAGVDRKASGLFVRGTLVRRNRRFTRALRRSALHANGSTWRRPSATASRHSCLAITTDRARAVRRRRERQRHRPLLNAQCQRRRPRTAEVTILRRPCGREKKQSRLARRVALRCTWGTMDAAHPLTRLKPRRGVLRPSHPSAASLVPPTTIAASVLPTRRELRHYRAVRLMAFRQAIG
jgi:hypothetical protein